MRFGARICVVVGALAVVPVLACAQGSERRQLLDAAMTRGIKSMSDGKKEQAQAAWSLVLAFDPNNTEAKNKIATLPSNDFSMSTPESDFVAAAIRTTSNEDWCGFPPPTPAMELVNLKMLADTHLLPSLKATRFGPDGITTLSPKPPFLEPLPDRPPMSGGNAPCSRQFVFVFLSKPLMSMADVRQRYGQPQTERKDKNGSESLTYGRFRILGGKDGRAVVVLFPPFKR